MSGKIENYLDKVIQIFRKNKRKFLVLILIFLLYIFVVVTYKVLSKIPKTPPPPKQYSYLDLIQFIGGYRTYQQDFEVEKIFFTRKALEFTLNVKFKPKTVLVVKKLAMDIVLGLIGEYPELESISVSVSSGSEKQGLVVYGRAVFSKDDNRILWKIR